MFFKSARLKNLKKNSRVKVFENKWKNISEETIVKVSIVIICILAFLFISFIYPNLFAWQNKSPSSTGQLEIFLPGRINPEYYRVLFVNLSKISDKDVRNISDIEIITVDNLNHEVNSYSIPLDMILNVNGKEITVSELYSTDYEHFVQALQSSLLIRTEYAIIFNEEHFNTALNKYSIPIDNSHRMEELFKKVQMDSFSFFKQGFWADWFAFTVTNQNSSEFKQLLSDVRAAKPIKFSTYSSEKLKNNILADPKIIKEQLRIEISNSSDLQGLATDYAKTFEHLGITISKVSNFDFISYQNLVFIPKEYENSTTFLTIKSMIGDAKFLYESPTKFSTADILVVVAK